MLKVVNEATVQAELLRGDVDIADVSFIKNADSDNLMKKGIKVVHYPNSKVQYMGFNLRDTRLDMNIRNAIAYGVDRDAIVKHLIEGNGKIIDTPMVPSLWSYPKKGLTHYVFDKNKAMSFLKKSWLSRY
ncbi:MAG: ABC transporter substrate-binding protein [Treponema sp.]